MLHQILAAAATTSVLLFGVALPAAADSQSDSETSHTWEEDGKEHEDKYKDDTYEDDEYKDDYEDSDGYKKHDDKYKKDDGEIKVTVVVKDDDDGYKKHDKKHDKYYKKDDKKSHKHDKSEVPTDVPAGLEGTTTGDAPWELVGLAGAGAAAAGGAGLFVIRRRNTSGV